MCNENNQDPRAAEPFDVEAIRKFWDGALSRLKAVAEAKWLEDLYGTECDLKGSEGETM